MTIKRSKEGVLTVRQQHKDDHYATPVSLAYASLLYLKQTTLNNITRPILYDAGVGDFGPFGFAARKIWPEAVIIGDDIRNVPHWPWYDWIIPCHDFTSDAMYNSRLFSTPDAFIGNPPFKKAASFVERAAKEYQLNFGLIFFLLRLAFAESEKRLSFFEKYPLYACTVCRKRPSWWLYDTIHKGKRSTNSTAYAFYSWIPNYHTRPKMNWLSWKYDNRLEVEFKEAIGV